MIDADSARKTTAILTRAAEYISLALIPPTVSTIVFTLLVLAFQHGALFHRILVWLVAILCSGILQMIYVLHLRKEERVTAYDVPVRIQRTKPYHLSAGISFAGFLALLYLDASIFIWSLMWCYAVNTLILSWINRYWKISAHLMGLAGPAVPLVPLFGLQTLYILPLVLLLGWARVHAQAHTIPEVVAGAMAGFLLTTAQLFLIFTYGVNVAGYIW